MTRKNERKKEKNKQNKVVLYTPILFRIPQIFYIFQMLYLKNRFLRVAIPTQFSSSFPFLSYTKLNKQNFRFNET